MRKLTVFGSLVAFAAAAVIGAAAMAADYPNRPVKIIVPRGAGGSADTVTRTFAPFLQKELGTSVVVENQPGASGKIALGAAFRAKADGYTLVVGNFPSYILTQHIEGGVDYVIREFEPVVGISGNEGNVLIVPGNSSFNSVQDLVKFDKENPGKLNMAITSGLSNSALALSMFVSKTELSAQRIPFDKGSAVVTAIMGGHVDVGVCSGVAAYGPAGDKTIKVLATFGLGEDEHLPNVPTFKSIYGEDAGYDVTVNLMAPPKTDPAALKILRDAAYKAVTSAEFQKAVGRSFNVVPQNAEELAKTIEANYVLADNARDALLSLSGN